MTSAKSAPPPVLDSARVILYAVVDKSVRYTRALHLYVGEKRLGKQPRLAICKNLRSGFKGYLILFCNKKWQTRGAVAFATLAEAKRAAESYYAGVAKRFVSMNVSGSAARQWIKKHNPESTCSFCGRFYFDCDAMIVSKKAVICSDCVHAFAGQIESSRPPL